MLELVNVCKTYKPKKGVPVQALKNISVKFGETGMVFILGKSGCGKSTLLNTIGGLDKFDSGEIIIKGKSSKEFSGSDFDSYRNTLVGFIFQEYNILSEFNVEKNIALALELQGKKATKERVQSLLEMVDLGDQGKRKTNELSGGQKQRIAIARALIKEPEIIIADEPTGALDSATGRQVFDTLKKLSTDRLVIIVSHDREFAETYADRIIEMKDGVIISDETKHHIQGQVLNDGMTVVGNDVIHIAEGHRITQKEVEFIAKYLNKNDGKETFISMNPRTNVKFREIAKIDENNASEKFMSTQQADINAKQYDKKDLKLIRSRLKLKDSFKMGASGLKSKPVRLVFTILLAFIAYTLFGFVDTLSAFNPVNNTVKSIQDSNLNYVSFGKSRLNEYGDWYNSTMMSEDDLVNLSVETGVEDFMGVYGFKSTNAYDRSLQQCFINYDYEKSYYTSNVAGVTEITPTLFDKLGFTFVGSLPATVNECMITKYQAEAFMEFGYKDKENNSITISKTKFAEDGMEQLLGMKIYINSNELTICGIVDTKFNSERYSVLKKRSNELTSAESLEATIYSNFEIRAIQSSSYHNILFCKQGAIESIEQASSVGTVGINAHMRLERGNNQESYSVASLQDVNGVEGITVQQSVPNFNNGVIINCTSWLVREFLKEYGSDSHSIPQAEMAKYVSASGLNSLYSYGMVETLQIAGLSIPGCSSDENRELSILYYLLFGSSGYDGNPSSLFEEIEDSNSDAQRLVNTFVGVFNRIVNGELKGSYYDSATYQTLKTFENLELGGLFYNSNGGNSYVICSTGIYNTIKQIQEGLGIYSFAIAPMPKNVDDITKVVRFHNQNLDDSRDFKDPSIYLMSNEITSIMDSVSDLTASMSKILLYVGLGICVFASLMLMNFISTSISYKKREIGILRALGSRKSDVFGIFFNESLIIALITFVLACAGTFVATMLLNNVLRAQYGLLITLFNFTLRQIVLILGVSVLVALVSSFLPVNSIARKQPIDAINNR